MIVKIIYIYSQLLCISQVQSDIHPHHILSAMCSRKVMFCYVFEAQLCVTETQVASFYYVIIYIIFFFLF